MSPEWVGPLLGLAGTALVVLGGVVGYLIVAKTTKAAAATQAAATAAAATTQAAAVAAVSDKTDAQALIDQLQEELKIHRDAQTARSTAQDERMTAQDVRMERLGMLVDGYRDYAHTLRAHIYDELPPPPPEWPDGLPR
ncbi:hypothetical protein [Agromyces ramosus]|uniref:Pyruvate/2-oxoglutarate dehydrogenase complex dihydrolipoamide acyltransferase (E2) component n=1 Tax=Agromyces ramosus TaxID=33879 RepID=A0ABU0R8M9_9MICO|nr:hypothetical protein [Agromyces ramosus]MDQ0894415.1 pyruvate/2-oxoglutarate dehydrogenase complex dihydrolipoamide acyltransferase (E2) component [Agromyces ramosus]